MSVPVGCKESRIEAMNRVVKTFYHTKTPITAVLHLDITGEYLGPEKVIDAIENGVMVGLYSENSTQRHIKIHFAPVAPFLWLTTNGVSDELKYICIEKIISDLNEKLGGRTHITWFLSKPLVYYQELTATPPLS